VLDSSIERQGEMERWGAKGAGEKSVGLPAGADKQTNRMEKRRSLVRRFVEHHDKLDDNLRKGGCSGRAPRL